MLWREDFVCHDPFGDWITDLERADEERRRNHEEGLDAFGLDEPQDEEPPRDYE